MIELVDFPNFPLPEIAQIELQIFVRIDQRILGGGNCFIKSFSENSLSPMFNSFMPLDQGFLIIGVIYGKILRKPNLSISRRRIRRQDEWKVEIHMESAASPTRVLTGLHLRRRLVGEGYG